MAFILLKAEPDIPRGCVNLAFGVSAVAMQRRALGEREEF
jgi:hypothetical protein